MKREQLKSLRPNIPSISQEDATSDAEQFQNQTLRPILKMQNELLLGIFRNYIDLRKGVFRKLTTDKKTRYIAEHIQQDKALRQFLLGIIVGQFTMEEWDAYAFEEKELNRRCIHMITQRIQDQLEIL